jgi:hypothetical protein
MKILKYLTLLLLTPSISFATGETRNKGDFINYGSLLVGASTGISTKAVFDAQSTTKGVLFPRLTTTQRDAISSPTNGLILYNTTNSAVEFYNGVSWGPLGSSGGGGGSLIWIEASGNSPTPVEENSGRVYKFQSGLGQQLFAAVRVPSGYTVGKQLHLKMPAYSPDISGTNLISCVSTLIRVTTDAITSTTNQRTSTNAAINLATGALANKVNSHSCDLTSTTGQINSVSLAAGDVVLVSLTRGTDTATSDIAALVYAAEVTFND